MQGIKGIKASLSIIFCYHLFLQFGYCFSLIKYNISIFDFHRIRFVAVISFLFRFIYYFSLFYFFLVYTNFSFIYLFETLDLLLPLPMLSSCFISLIFYGTWKMFTQFGTSL